MKKTTCKLRGHKIAPIETMNIQLKEFECTRCKTQFTIDGYGKIVRLNSYWKENHLLFENYFRRQAAI